MARDAERMRGDGPSCSRRCTAGVGVQEIVRSVRAAWVAAITTGT